MSLITYTTAFTGGPSYFTGISGASELVPHIFPVSIDGRPYLLDTWRNLYQPAGFVEAWSDILAFRFQPEVR